MLIQKNAEGELSEEAKAVVNSFGQRYGGDKQILRINSPEKLHMVYWDNDGIVQVSMLVGDVWIEIFQGVVGEEPVETMPE